MFIPNNFISQVCFLTRKPSNLTPQANVIKFVLLNNKFVNTGWSLIPVSLKHPTELFRMPVNSYGQ